MSLYDYKLSKKLSEDDPTFAALIMTALRKADTQNAAKLRAQWPEICAEMQARYDAPRGLLPSEIIDRLVCRDCGKEVEKFNGWAFCGGGCKGDPDVKLNALHDWTMKGAVQ